MDNICLLDDMFAQLCRSNKQYGHPIQKGSKIGSSHAIHYTFNGDARYAIVYFDHDTVHVKMTTSLYPIYIDMISKSTCDTALCKTHSILVPHYENVFVYHISDDKVDVMLRSINSEWCNLKITLVATAETGRGQSLVA